MTREQRIGLSLAMLGVLIAVVALFRDVLDFTIPRRETVPATMIAPTPIPVSGITDVSTSSTSEREAIVAPTRAPEPSEEPTALPITVAVPTEPPTLTPTPNTLLFEDTFDRKQKPEWRVEHGDWRVVNNEFTITNIDPNRKPEGPYSSGLVLIGDENWTNYRVKVDVNLKGTNGMNGGGIRVRLRDTRNFLEIVFRDKGNPYSNWFITKDGKSTEVPNTRFKDYPIDTPFTLEIELIDDVVVTYIDGQEVNSWSGAPYPTGSVGVVLASRSVEAPMSIDNFSVRTLQR
jgi:hypothetical protein